MGVVSPFAVDAARVTTGMGLPTTMTWHCMLGALEPVLRVAGYVGRWAERGVAMNAVSRVAAAPLQRIVGPAGQVKVLPNGIDVARWAAPAGAPARHADDGTQGIRLVSAMRLAGRKRPLQLLRVVRRVRELAGAAVPLHLDVLGEGPQRGRLERYVARNGLEGVVSLPGRVAREELPERYAAADIYIAPGRLESFGIAALEARTAGLPVVGRAGSGIEEFVRDGVNGYLAGDDEAMARALARLVGDGDLRATMAAYNREHPPEQSWDDVVAGAEAEYERARSLAGVR
jgi:glycosyltransferase involved in cell wall biosynthesis